jgi:hypothetical protein
MRGFAARALLKLAIYELAFSLVHVVAAQIALKCDSVLAIQRTLDGHRRSLRAE